MSDRFRVQLYTEGLWCVCDFANERHGKSPIVRHDGSGQADVPYLFSDRAEAQAFADRKNRESSAECHLCPECGKPCLWDEGDPGDRQQPPIAARWFCPSCGVELAYGLSEG